MQMAVLRPRVERFAVCCNTTSLRESFGCAAADHGSSSTEMLLTVGSTGFWPFRVGGRSFPELRFCFGGQVNATTKGAFEDPPFLNFYENLLRQLK